MAAPHEDIEHLFADFPALPTRGPFDERGMPAGDLSMWDPMLLEMEAHIDQGGWDQVAMVWLVASPAFTAAMLEDDPQVKAAVDAAVEPLDGDVVGRTNQAVVPFVEVSGYPVAELMGLRAPDWASALVFSFEGWTLPASKLEGGTRVPTDNPEGLPPSLHPDRVEMRSVLMVTRSGQARAVYRSRGEEPYVQPSHQTHEGFLTDVLRRVIGADVPDAGEYTVPRLLRQLFLHTMAAHLHRTFEGDIADDAPAEVRRELEAVRAELKTMSDADRHELGASVAGSVLARTLAWVTFLVSGKGKRGFDRSMGRVLRDVATGKRADVTRVDYATVCACAASVGRNLTWDQVAATSQLTQLLGPLDGKVRWAGTGLLSKWVCERELTDDEAALDVVRDLAGTATEQTLRSLLDGLGWVRPQSVGPETAAASEPGPDTGVGTGPDAAASSS